MDGTADQDFDVTVTITFSTRIGFASNLVREGPVTGDDALANFYGMGLDEVLNGGEYRYSVDHVSVQSAR